MPIESSGEIRLRGTAGDNRTDINEEINGNATDTDVSLGTLNTSAFTNVADGTTISGRSMSEMRGYAAFTSAFPSTEADGALDKSLYFNASGEIVYLDRNTDFTNTHTTSTFSFWLKLNDIVDGTKTIFSTGNSQTDRVWFQLSSATGGANDNRPYILASVGNSNVIQLAYDYIINDASSWYHFVIAVDTTKDYQYDRVRMYINGIELKDLASSRTPIWPSKNQGIYFNNNQRIGDIYWASGYGNDMTIADFKFIEGQQLRPDSFGELVQGIWIPKAFNTASTDTLVTSNLIAKYELNGDANDTSGSATTYNGTASNVSFISNNYGVGEFNGTSSEINTGISSISSPFAVTMWINEDVLASGIFFNNWNSTAADMYFITTSDGRLRISIDGYSNEFFGTAGDVSINTWHHIAVTLSSGTYEVYLDGTSLGTSTTSVTTFSSGQNFKIGNSAKPTSPDYFDGKIGEVQIYSSGLTSAQILQNYNATKHKYTYGVNGFWLPLNNTSTGSIDSSSNLKLHLDASNSSSYGGSGTTWSDLSGNSANATLNGVTFLSSTNGGVFDFDGSNDDATIDDTKINYSNFSLEFWINPDANLTASNTLFSRYSTTASQNTWHIRGNDTNNGIEFIRYPSGVNGVILKDNSVVPVNKWTHIVITHNETSSVLKIYKNGSLDATHSISGNLVTGSTLDLLIGNLQGYNFRYNGQLAQIRFYNDILTAQEIITNYRATQGNYEQVSTVDISGNANSFTATNIDYTDHIPDEPLDNYATLNPNEPFADNFTFSEGNTKFTSAVNGYHTSSATMALNSGKWYVEFKFLGSSAYGSARIGPAILGDRTGINSYGGTTNDSWMWGSSGAIYHNNSNIATSSVTATTNDIIGFAIDLDNHRWFISKNGSWQYSHDPATPSTGIDISGFTDYFIGFHAYNSSDIAQFDFGQNGFTYTPPTGFKAMSFKNLPAPAFDPDGVTPDKPSNYFKAVTYQGTGGTQGEAYGYKDGSRAAVFNGSNSKINLGTSSTWANNQLSFAFWYKPTAAPSGATYEILFSNYTTSFADGFFNVSRNNDYSLEIGLYAGSGWFYRKTVANAVVLNEWTHVAIVLDNTQSALADKVKFYINGSSFTHNDNTNSGTPSGNFLNNSNSFYIGHWDHVTGYNDAAHYDDIRIYNKVLNSTEVGYLADDDTSNINSISNLIAYYDMEGDANDESGSATTYNGAPSNVTFTQDKPYGNINAGFAPDLVWIKDRFDGADQHALFDIVRGAPRRIFSSSNSSQSGTATTLTRFDTNGFTLSSSPAVNENGNDYIAWVWKAGGKAVENTDGTITSQVSANQNAGFSIVKYTGNSTAGATIGHGLSQKPELFFIKNLGYNVSWIAWCNEENTKLGYLDTTDSFANSRYSWALNSTQPTSTLITLGNDISVNTSYNYIAYCFHSVDGFSKIGSYTGNSSTDGPFVYTGFKPAWIIVKNIDNSSNTHWGIFDNARDTNNQVVSRVLANLTNAESTTDSNWSFNFYSNGFKPTASSLQANSNGDTYIYMAFAEDPVKYSNGVATLGDGNEFIQGSNYPEDNFTTTTYTGNGGTQSISSLNYQPDLVWIKSRNVGYSNHIQDVIRGAGSLKDISSDGAWAEGTYNYGSVDFDTNGFTVGSGGHPTYGRAQVNESGRTYVAWSWKAAGNANTYNILENGTVTSSASASTLGLDTGTITPIKVSANRDNGFSIMNFTGTSTAGDTVPHGLSKPPEFVIAKQYSGSSEDWFTWHKDYGISGGEYQWLRLNDGTNIPATFNNEAVWNNVAPSSTLFTLNGGGSPNRSGDKHIYYSWHSVPGYSKIGKYTGKGSTAAFNVYLGFEPAWILIRRIDSGNYWSIFDNKRDQDGQMNLILYPNRPDIESNGQTTTSVTVDSDGFSFTTSQYGGSINTNGGEYIYMAFAHR